MGYPGNFINRIICGDCLETMRGMPNNCIDTIITDPPYNLGFMNKKWDRTGISFNIKLWEEVLRVAKPGATLLCFGGTRTYHRLACAIEDAGWIIKDCIMWIYGSGFPKATDISKQIDKKAKKNIKIVKAKKELGEWLKDKRGNKSQKEISKHFLSKTSGLTGCVANWELGFNLPTWEIWIKLKELLDLDNRFDYLIEGRPKNYIEAERKIIGKDSRKANNSNFGCGLGEWDITAPATPKAILWNGWKSHGLKPAYETILVCMKPNEGSYANNALKWKVAGLNIDGSRIQFEKGGTVASNPKLRVERGCKTETGDRIFCQGELGKKNTMVENVKKGGRYPANVLLDEEAGRSLDKQSGECKTGGKICNTDCGNSIFGKRIVNTAMNTDNGKGASRFFYCAKASKAERNKGCEGLEGKVIDIQQPHNSKNLEERYSMTSKNNHPTVKPLALIKYLVKLTMMPNKDQIYLDLFCGSGTTLMACKELKRDYIGIDNNPEYCGIARRRIKAIPESLF